MALTGRLPWLAALAAAALPFARRLGVLLRVLPLMHKLGQTYRDAGAGPPPRTGQQSEIRTRFFRMQLDHDTGQMDGEIVEGPFKHKRLTSLALPELLQQLAVCQEDPDSVQVLEAYLDRAHSDWREQAGDRPHPDAGGTTMDRKQALEILGLSEGATRDDIIEAHRRLMQKMHPDRGGSTYLAAKINEAKDLLLG